MVDLGSGVKLFGMANTDEFSIAYRVVILVQSQNYLKFGNFQFVSREPTRAWNMVNPAPTREQLSGCFDYNVVLAGLI